MADPTIIQLDWATVTGACTVIGGALTGFGGYIAKLGFAYLRERDEKVTNLGIKVTDLIGKLETIDQQNRADQRAVNDRLIKTLIDSASEMAANTQATRELTNSLKKSQ